MESKGAEGMKRNFAPALPITLAPLHLRARIAEVPIKLHSTSKGRKIAWSHFWQIIYILRYLTKSGRDTYN